MADKLVLLGNVRKKLYYIFRSYGTSECLKNDILKALKKISAADVEPVIRCRDCQLHKNCVTDLQIKVKSLKAEFTDNSQ